MLRVFQVFGSWVQQTTYCIRKSAKQTTIVTSAMQTILMLNILAHNLQLKVLSVGVFKRLVSQIVIYETFDSINQWEEKSLPVAFSSSLSEKKLDKAVIKSCLGSWCVRLGRSVDGVLSFEEGWEVFVNHHGLNIGEMVVFEHKGKMVFTVVAYESW
ncbi:hypothetical protein PRUPE_1G519100 [Prunus persica]|uniref:TF-B3 domain-containing protein n=1 Tax=Prunus persica TaxID=3760 RepID=A0A251RGH0_PRUPE|nr:hypothetical protein PRUPE_1G519100 [Prunus persica]